MATFNDRWNAESRIESAEGRPRSVIPRIDNVGAGLAEDDDQNRRLAVGVARIAQVFHGILRWPISEIRTADPLR